MTTLLSFVIPCYRSENTIMKVLDEIRQTVAQRAEYSYEIICVNDCSPDNVWQVLLKAAEEDVNVKLINFSDNSGKDAALLAGYAAAKGDYIVSLDDDFQCPADRLWDLLEPVQKDECDVCTAKYAEKKQAGWKNLGSDLNMLMSRTLLNQPKNLRMENFLVLKRFVVEEIIKYDNSYPYLEGLILRVTKRIKAVEMEERDRADNNSTGFTLKKSISLFANGMTSFSVKPLRVSTFVGLLSAFLGLVFAIVVAVRRIIGAINVEGYSSIIILILIIGGLILMSLGLIGEYIGRIYICLNKSPQYVIRERVNF